jgi:hypothetical protein
MTSLLVVFRPIPGRVRVGCDRPRRSDPARPDVPTRARTEVRILALTDPDLGSSDLEHEAGRRVMQGGRVLAIGALLPGGVDAGIHAVAADPAPSSVLGQNGGDGRKRRDARLQRLKSAGEILDVHGFEETHAEPNRAHLRLIPTHLPALQVRARAKFTRHIQGQMNLPRDARKPENRERACAIDSAERCRFHASVLRAGQGRGRRRAPSPDGLQNEHGQNGCELVGGHATTNRGHLCSIPGGQP